MKLIVNADDFGLSRGTNYGIFDSHIKGIVTSTTLMVTMPEVEHALVLARFAPKLNLGLHLNMTYGTPITNCPSLVKKNNTFYKVKEIKVDTTFDEEEIYLEFKAQYERFINLVGKKPTHLDSHLYAHQKYAKATRAVKKLALEVNVPVRDLSIDGFVDVHFIDWFKFNPETPLDAILKTKLPELKDKEVCELMVHPAYLDPFLMESSSYNIPRVEELKVLTSDDAKTLLKTYNIELSNYKDATVREK